MRKYIEIRKLCYHNKESKLRFLVDGRNSENQGPGEVPTTMCKGEGHKPAQLTESPRGTFGDK